MHAPFTLLIASAVLGVLLPFVVNICALSLQNSLAAATLQTIGLAAAPIIIARVAFRQGFDEGAAKHAPQGQ